MKTHRIAVVPGDGIGEEIVPCGLSVMQACADKFNFKLVYDNYPWGAGYYKKTGSFLPENGLEILGGYDAIYFGAVGLPDVDDRFPARDYTFKVRNHFQQYVNYRPVKLLPGVPGPLKSKNPQDIDFVILRENNEGEFVQHGAILRGDSATGVATDTNVFTRFGIERIAHYAFRLAQKRRKKVTNVTKSNTLIYTLAYWDQIIEEVSQSYPDVAYQKMYVDNAAASFVLRPELFDVVVTTNMIGDILSDLGGAIMGSLGLGPSGNINPEKAFPSMFEPIHGSAPDIAGQGVANPVGQIWSGALLLNHLGESTSATLIEKAIEDVCTKGIFTRDLGGNHSTQSITDAILEYIGSV
jgi:tartrate dehydrogenase/decarboxylase/D-malate dehydrogenase